MRPIDREFVDGLAESPASDSYGWTAFLCLFDELDEASSVFNTRRFLDQAVVLLRRRGHGWAEAMRMVLANGLDLRSDRRLGYAWYSDVAAVNRVVWGADGPVSSRRYETRVDAWYAMAKAYGGLPEGDRLSLLSGELR